MWKRAVFSVYEKPSDKEKLFQHTKISISHCIKTNVQLQISSAKTYCELAVQQFFFVKTSVLRLHYGNPFAPIQSLTGDTRKACNARRGRVHDERRSLPRKPWIERRFESQVAGRSPVCFLVTFCTMQKVTIRSLCRELRGFPNLDSAHPNIKYTLTKLKPSQRELRGSANLESAHRDNNNARIVNSL